MSRWEGLEVPILGLCSCLCSREYGNSTEVDRRGSFTFIPTPQPPACKKTQGCSGRHCDVIDVIRVREFVFKGALYSFIHPHGCLLSDGAACYLGWADKWAASWIHFWTWNGAGNQEGAYSSRRFYLARQLLFSGLPRKKKMDVFTSLKQHNPSWHKRFESLVREGLMLGLPCCLPTPHLHPWLFWQHFKVWHSKPLYNNVILQ